MATTITIGGTEVSYQSFSIDVPLSPVDIAPSATVRTQARESIAPNDDVTITIDGAEIFSNASTTSAGEKSEVGGRKVKAEHDAVTLFGEAVDVSQANATDEDVLQAALSNANSGGSFTLDYAGTATSLGNDYTVENREVKQVFRDMMDRTSRVWWVDPAGSTIHVEPLGHRGTWQAIDTQTDKATVLRFNEGSRDSVRNDVTVVGTGEERVEGSDTDATSISTYGRQSEEVNVEYITTTGEAGDMASELLIPNPLASGKVLAGSNVGDVTQPLVNYTIDLTDVPKDIDETGLVVESQTIEQGRATLQVGEGSGVSLSNVNRMAKSRDDLTAGGDIYGTDRISDDAITSTKLVDTAVIEEKIADLSISETKIQDDSISTPKLKAEAVTAAKILAGTITAAEIAAGTLTANEIDVLDLDAADISILNGSGEGLEFNLSGSTVVMEPTPSGSAGIGSDSNRMGLSFFSTVHGGIVTDSIFPENPSDSSTNFQVVGEDFADNAFKPGEDNRNYIGTASQAFREMNAHNFVTASPDPIDAVDCGGLCDVDWYDNPPEPVRQRARDIGETDAEIPEDMDHTPVELGTMANWLLETCKSQQELIESQRDRLDDLAERVAALEEAG